ncbi:DMP19 family protein [Xanthomonas campestris pv. phormiicola]|nr:DMP19 family protein [Xanthomonas campestris pv. phormiicola]UYC17637.1 DMP19 family protein [Xanthomonas campestris pv. phormiicola]
MEVESLTDAALKKLQDHGFDTLGDCDRLLVTIWGLEADVNNGDFDQYYFNSYGDQAKMAPSALRAIGANRMAEIVELANTEFGQEGPPGDSSARRSRLEEISEDAAPAWDALEEEFWSYPDDIAALLTAHLATSG